MKFSIIAALGLVFTVLLLSPVAVMAKPKPSIYAYKIARISGECHKFLKKDFTYVSPIVQLYSKRDDKVYKCRVTLSIRDLNDKPAAYRKLHLREATINQLVASARSNQKGMATLKFDWNSRSCGYWLNAYTSAPIYYCSGASTSGFLTNGGQCLVAVHSYPYLFIDVPWTCNLP